MGYIRLDRKFFEGKYWKQERSFSQAEAWLDLIQMARFEVETATKLLANGREISIKRGEIHASLRYLSTRWGWGVDKVKRFFDIAIKNNDIERRIEQGESVIILCNYDNYNPISNTDPYTDPYTDQTVTRTPTRTNNKKDKKLKNEKEVYIITSSSKDSEVICETLPPHPPDESPGNIDYKKLIDWFNDATKGVFGTLRYPLSDVRKGMIQARIRQHGKQTFFEVLTKTTNSDFLKGHNNRSWKATFDWMIKPTNFDKILSGNYDNRSSGASIDDDDFINNLLKTRDGNKNCE